MRTLLGILICLTLSGTAEAGFRVNRAHRVIERHDARVQRRHERRGHVRVETAPPPAAKEVKVGCATCPDCQCGPNCNCLKPCCCGACTGMCCAE